MGEMPLITIITPCLNREKLIGEAVQSVLHQNYPQVEHIIIDGGSTDGTLVILNRYPHLRVISEPDQGMYDAINKGIRLAKGEIIGFLNTDDYYEPNIFENIIQNFNNNPIVDAVAGGADIFEVDDNDERNIIEIYRSPKVENLLKTLTQGVPIFNAWFFRSQVFYTVGVFNTQYLYSSDRDFLLRFYLFPLEFANLEKTIYHYRQHPTSATISGHFDGEAKFVFETLDVAEEYLNNFDLIPEERNQFLIWHSQLTTDQVITAFRNKSLGKIREYSQRGRKYNPNWLIIFLKRFLTGLLRLVKRKLETTLYANHETNPEN